MSIMFISAIFSFKTPGKNRKDLKLGNPGVRKVNMFLKPCGSKELTYYSEL